MSRFIPPTARAGAADRAGGAAPLDRFGRPLRDLRISVTDRCNFRCRYCMPREVFGPGFAFLPRDQILSFEEIARVAHVAAGLGVRKVRLTGGEPLLRAELPRLVAMLAAIPLALAPEIMQGWLGVAPVEAAGAAGLGPAGWIALSLVALIVIQIVWEAANTGRRLRPRYSSSGWDNPVRALLWMFGIFQSYRLFDWVDERNHHVRFEVTRVGGYNAPTDADALFPRTMRHLLLQSYLVGNIWMRMSPGQLDQVRRSLLIRHARRYARAHPDAGTIDAVAIVQRVTKDNLELTQGVWQPQMRFTCRGGKAVMQHPKEEG